MLELWNLAHAGIVEPCTRWKFRTVRTLELWQTFSTFMVRAIPLLVLARLCAEVSQVWLAFLLWNILKRSWKFETIVLFRHALTFALDLSGHDKWLSLLFLQGLTKL